MQNPRRPPAERRGASGGRDRPVSWNRRLEEAREARARVLAARKAEEGDGLAARKPGAAEHPAPGPHSLGEVPPPPPEDESPGRSSGARRATILWRIAGGVLVGAAVGAVAIWVLLAAGQKTPPGAQTGDTTGPAVASAPPEAASERPAQIPAAETAPAVEETAADDGVGIAGEVAGIAALPEVTAADRARGAARQTAADVEEAADPESHGTDMAAPSRPEDAAGMVSHTEVASLADTEPAPLENGVPHRQSPEASTEEQSDSTRASVEAGGVTVAAQGTGTPDTANADGAATDNTREEAVATGAERAVEVATSVPEPSPDPPRAPELMQTEAPDATGAASAETMEIGPPDAESNAVPQERGAAGVGLLYVHAAPGVTSEDLAAVAARLSDAGYAIEETRRVDFRISRTNVRYFHDEDAELSAGVAETISAISRDFTDYEPSPDPGTIEIWLEG